jgi:hypothetical protein
MVALRTIANRETGPTNRLLLELIEGWGWHRRSKVYREVIRERDYMKRSEAHKSERRKERRVGR